MNETIKTVLNEMSEFEKQWDAKFAIDHATGDFLYKQVLQRKPSHILELGTWRGASAIYMASALIENKLGKLTTVDRGNDRVEQTTTNLHKAGVDHVVTQVVQEIDEFLENNTDTYDFVFMDAAKKPQARWLEQLLDHNLKKGSLVIIDDVITMRDKTGDLFPFVENHPRLQSKVEEIDDGLLVIEVIE